ncbi:MAG: hypothetical protein RMK57_13425 [Bryobacterales bacterium]|nr:hypothetical protein [Bryobacteraceae bacterium]MDW8355519.1 hypothetical protein [Bryobacterales bacterium]
MRVRVRIVWRRSRPRGGRLRRWLQLTAGVALLVAGWRLSDDLRRGAPAEPPVWLRWQVWLGAAVAAQLLASRWGGHGSGDGRAMP